jgi:hypothetical protein
VGRIKDTAAKDFLAFLPSIPAKDILIYSNGSKMEAMGGSISAGFMAYQYGL